MSPDNTPADDRETDANTLARQTVQRFSIGPDDEHMLLELLGLLHPADTAIATEGAEPVGDADFPRESAMSG